MLNKRKKTKCIFSPTKINNYNKFLTTLDKTNININNLNNTNIKNNPNNPLRLINPDYLNNTSNSNNTTPMNTTSPIKPMKPKNDFLFKKEMDEIIEKINSKLYINDTYNVNNINNINNVNNMNNSNVNDPDHYLDIHRANSFHIYKPLNIETNIIKV